MPAPMTIASAGFPDALGNVFIDELAITCSLPVY
jgi:hypothetical protein